MNEAPRSPADTPEPAGERGHVIVRTFDLPASVLFRCWSEPAHLVRWFGPKGWPLTLCEVDFRVGGRFRFAMTGPSGVQNTPFGGEYLAIEPDRLIAYSNTFEEAGAETMIVTVTFEEHDGKTVQRLHTLFGSVAMKDLHLGYGYEAGTRSAQDQLAALGASLVAS